MQTYSGHATALVADVDCTAAGKDLCEQHGVQGYPTIKFGDPSALEDYEGRRSAEALESFAADNLKPLCSPKNLDLCDDEKKIQIADLMALSADELDAEIAKKEAEFADAGTVFDAEVEKLQSRYEELEKEKSAKQTAIKNDGLGLMKAVLASMSASEKGEL